MKALIIKNYSNGIEKKVLNQLFLISWKTYFSYFINFFHKNFNINKVLNRLFDISKYKIINM
jgi:hypothetical protein